VFSNLGVADRPFGSHRNPPYVAVQRFVVENAEHELLYLIAAVDSDLHPLADPGWPRRELNRYVVTSLIGLHEVVPLGMRNLQAGKVHRDRSEASSLELIGTHVSVTGSVRATRSDSPSFPPHRASCQSGIQSESRTATSSASRRLTCRLTY
jgi:hypothetical protein